MPGVCLLSVASSGVWLSVFLIVSGQFVSATSTSAFGDKCLLPVVSLCLPLVPVSLAISVYCLWSVSVYR